MTDVLIRDAPDEVVAAIEDKAQSLQRFHQRCSDLGDREVMRGAWE